MSWRSRGRPAPVRARAKWSAELALRAPWQARFPFRSPAAVERAQRRRVAHAVSHAYEHVPYYRETMRRLGLRPADFQAASDLARLPILDRAELQRDPEYFVSRAQPLESYVKLRTSGTSGQPVTIFRDPRMLFQEAAYGERHRAVIMKLAGRRLRFRVARIVTPTSVSRVAAGAFQQRSFIPFGVRFVQRYLSLYDSPARNVELINEFGCDVIGSYGSYVEALFRYVEESGSDFHVPRVVAYGADALPDPARRRITQHFGATVLSVYGAIEAPSIGFECEQHLGHHLNVDIHPVRIVDSDEVEVATGKSGEVIVSNLVSRGTMLLNYRLGDIASKLPARCRCGRSLPLLSFLEGRIDDWLQVPSGEMLHPQAAIKLFAAEEEIWQGQVIQHTPERFELAVLPADGCNRAELQAKLVRKFRERFGPTTVAHVSFVESLPRTERGKVRAVISMAQTQQRARTTGVGVHDRSPEA
jgi:phenylacetate-CoA ligase